MDFRPPPIPGFEQTGRQFYIHAVERVLTVVALHHGTIDLEQYKRLCIQVGVQWHFVGVKDLHSWAGSLVSVLQQLDGDGSEATLFAIVTRDKDGDLQRPRATVLRLTKLEVEKVESLSLKI